MTLGFSVGAVTDVGSRRESNQDQLLAMTKLVAVADGMGGHYGGEVASQVAVSTIETQFNEGRIINSEDIIAAVRLANGAVREGSATDPSLAGMGTTLVVLALVESGSDLAAEGEQGTMVVVNVGDSRAYALRGGALVQLTQDHSLVNTMVQEGRISEEEALVHPQRNIVTRALGVEDTVQPDEFRHQVEPGMRFLLCSDGLSNEVPDDEIAHVLATFESPQDAAQNLVEMANRNGGRDNISVVVVDITDEDDAYVDPRVVTNETDVSVQEPSTTVKKRSRWRARFFRS